MRYIIENIVTGHWFGEYEGESEKQALDAMARDAGYQSYKDACETTPVIMGEIVATECENV
jgi:hypothetical protein